MSVPRTAADYARIREANAKLVEAERKKFVPEPNIAKDLAFFAVGRYVSGNFKGLFTVAQMISEDGHGKLLKIPIRKTIADGVDIAFVLASLETALRKRVFR